MNITFVKHTDVDHYEKLIPPLKEILQWLAIYLAKSKALRLIYTSIYRDFNEEKAKGRSGVHGLYQAADVVIYKDGQEAKHRIHLWRRQTSSVRELPARYGQASAHTGQKRNSQKESGGNVR